MRKPVLLVCAVFACGLLAACGSLAPAREGLWEELGLAPDQAVAAADDREISAGLYLYWLTEITDGIRQYYSEEGQEPDWSATVEEGVTLGQYAKEQALESAAVYASVENWAQRYDCALTEADRAEAAQAWNDTAAEHGGEDTYLAVLAQKGLDEAGGRRMAEDHILYQKLCDLALEEGSRLWEETADLAEFYTQRGYVTVDLVEFSADGAEEAASLFGRINESADPVAELAGIRQERGQSGWPRTLLPGDGSLPRPDQRRGGGTGGLCHPGPAGGRLRGGAAGADGPPAAGERAERGGGGVPELSGIGCGDVLCCAGCAPVTRYGAI